MYDLLLTGTFSSPGNLKSNITDFSAVFSFKFNSELKIVSQTQKYPRRSQTWPTVTLFYNPPHMQSRAHRLYLNKYLVSSRPFLTYVYHHAFFSFSDLFQFSRVSWPQDLQKFSRQYSWSKIRVQEHSNGEWLTWSSRLHHSDTLQNIAAYILYPTKYNMFTLCLNDSLLKERDETQVVFQFQQGDYRVKEEWVCAQGVAAAQNFSRLTWKLPSS